MKTSQLEDKLSAAESFEEELVAANGAPEVSALIFKHMAEKNLSRAELIRRLNVDRNYGYQLLNGTRTPTRDHLIQISLLLGLNVEQLRRLLKAARKKPLYVRDMFDAKVFYAVKHKMNYEEAAEFIWK